MKKTGIFYGSSSGVTEENALKVAEDDQTNVRLDNWTEAIRNQCN